MANNIGWADVTLVAGVGTGSWQHPEDAPPLNGSNANARTVDLDFAPIKVDITCTVNDIAHVGVVKVESATSSAVRLISTHNGDTSKFRCWARCDYGPYDRNWGGA